MARVAFEVTFKRETCCGEPGWSYEVRDAAGRFRAGGWSRGKKSDAAADAHAAIARLENRSAA